MLSISVIVLLVTQGSWVTMLPMVLMSLAWPVANLIGQASQKKDYRRKVQQREADYRQRMAEERKRLEGLAQQQRSLLEGAYPALHVLMQMALAQSPRMWSRRPTDDDFLSLRLGTGEGPPSFTVEMPRLSGEDTLLELAAEVVQEFRSLPNLPLLLDLKRCGSVAISGPPASVYGLARRLVLDLVVHHSPEDVWSWGIPARPGRTGAGSSGSPIPTLWRRTKRSIAWRWNRSRSKNAWSPCFPSTIFAVAKKSSRRARRSGGRPSSSWWMTPARFASTLMCTPWPSRATRPRST